MSSQSKKTPTLSESGTVSRGGSGRVLRTNVTTGTTVSRGSSERISNGAGTSSERISNRGGSRSSAVDLESATGALRAARARQSVARLDYLRGLRDVTRTGLATQSAIARELGISQSAVSQNLQEEAKLAPVLEGFHGADPQEIIARFAAGDLSRTQVVDELSRWPYAPSDELEGPMDDLLVTVRGSFDDVEDAAVSGVLPADVYGEILTRLAEQNDTSS